MLEGSLQSLGLASLSIRVYAAGVDLAGSVATPTPSTVGVTSERDLVSFVVLLVLISGTLLYLRQQFGPDRRGRAGLSRRPAKNGTYRSNGPDRPFQCHERPLSALNFGA